MSIHVAADRASRVLPLVSVCIPTYNRASKLDFCVRRLLACDYGNIEIIISDNASVDDTQSIGKALSLENSRVSYHRHGENLGITRNFEFVRSQAKGKYFLWHADDDYLDSDYITVCVSALEKDETLVLVSGLSIYDRNDQLVPSNGNVIQLTSDIPELRVLKYLWHVADDSIFCGAYRTAAVIDCELPQILAGDWAWISEIASIGKARVFPSILVHREAGKSASSSPEGYKKLVSVLGLPNWNALIPEFAIAFGISRRILVKSKIFRRMSFIRRSFLGTIVFVLILVKLAVPFLMRTMMKISPLVSAYRYVKSILR